ncbi:MAG: ChbG/HpnK family deacetylase [Oscillospiraceae bacterium]|nr:ChbG/HpnK family deacetylase [Oscillospiraceae bacterium]
MKIILSADDFGSTHQMNLATDYAMRNHLVCSTALMMGSAFTQEAIDLACEGNYLEHVHCHLNLSANRCAGRHYVPLNENFKKSRFCKDGEFVKYNYYRPDYRKYVEVFFQELETQYLTFQELTKGQANYQHLDFHLYANLSLPVAAAYDRLIQKYNIQSARFFGAHQAEKKEPLILRGIHGAMMHHWKHSKAYKAKSSRIEYFLVKRNEFERDELVELFVHLDYRDGVVIDKTASLFGNEKQPLEECIQRVQETGDVSFISWASLNEAADAVSKQQ